MDVPEGQVQDNSYVTGTKSNQPIPVQSDNARVEDPIDTKKADTDEQLEQDDKEAIDKSNMMKNRTRGAKPRETYKEPSDEQGLGE
ncbi:hypothetical protein J3459_005998 [Metarhizium acridum]|uniref:Uncharacterized protein n=1 Tax=Metarhizium acridum (strain CQMa 102) TaxID=655827 RepID=E9EDR2_METAQ|nr:uncharacterized protein MAC_08010 [Metarhizium acridum CQMa 102]EFY85927.1 hypothetical protein MAC_08010 [Metarhizium acridum CQMa 102]KAG8410143.1 hypothetical protein J3459_017346 [Metarhizium acridum]KAG8428156.1 hypothetical protein J3459_005998 [Metarhizium acridum]